MACTIIDINEQKLIRSYDKISKAIVDYINSMNLVWEIEIARRVYFGEYMDIRDEEKYQGYKPFIQWLIFSYKLHNGLSLLDSIYEKYADDMNKWELETLSCFRNTHEGFYMVYSVEPDKGSILVKNIFTNDMLKIWDSLMAKSVKRYYGIFMRIASLNGRLIPIPGYSVMSNSFLKNTKFYIMEKYRQYKKYNKEASVNKFISSNSLMIHRYFLHYDL